MKAEAVKDKRRMSDIDRAIRVFLATGPTGSAPALAMMFQAKEPAICAKWLAGKLAAMISREMKAARPAKSHPYQMFLFGFKALSARVPLQGGLKLLGKATIRELRESLSMMTAKARNAARANPRTEALAQLIDEMSPFARSHHGLTVERFCELKAAGVEIAKVKKAAGR
jgi:hypothetical protein